MKKIRVVYYYLDSIASKKSNKNRLLKNEMLPRDSIEMFQKYKTDYVTINLLKTKDRTA